MIWVRAKTVSMVDNFRESADLSVSDEILEEANELLERGAQAETHQAKIVALSDFLSTIFDVDLDDIFPGIEQRIGSKILGVSGRIDLFYQGPVLEMKSDFADEYDNAIDKLRDSYFPLLLEENPEGKYVGLVTDMNQFELVRPVLEDGEVTEITTIDRINARREDIRQVIFWLDSVIFSGKVQTPSADELHVKFGPGSPIYELAIEDLSALWDEVEGNESARFRLDLWTRMMEIVYGSSPDEDAFVAQTYLAILVKLLVKLRLEPSPPRGQDEFIEIMDGEYFANHGITNLIEEDFFSWILDGEVQDDAFGIAKKLARALNVYDTERAKEDLFKEVFQEIISLHQRHGTGEYYTPRWLCEFTLKEALEPFGSESEDFPRLLDPACGSGGFLTAGIHELLNRSEDQPPEERLNQITEKIQGIDVNPLAVIIARANYAIALGDLLNVGQQITIPVFAADAIKLPDLQASLHHGVRCYAIEIENRVLLIPESIATNTEQRMSVLNSLGQASRHYREGLSRDQAIAYLNRLLPEAIDDKERSVLQETLRDVLHFVDDAKDHIWIYLLNNFYATIIIKDEAEDPVELLIGNPPWIVMRSISNQDYQDFLKHSVQEYDLLDDEDIKLYTHMEMATLFFRRTPDIYLEDGGRIAYIMPVSVTTGAMHHKNFNEFDNPLMSLDMVHSFRGVRNVFSLPPCVLFAELGQETEFPTSLTEWNGSLTGVPRNAEWERVASMLESSSGRYSPAEIPTDESPYYDDVYEGATITPRNLYYVEFERRGELGVDSSTPLVKTSNDVARVAGKRWKDVRMEGNVEARFIHASYLGKDIIPFGTLPPRPVVIPSIVEGGKRLLLDEVALRNRGFPNTAEWLEEAEEHWSENQTEKSSERFESILDRLDYHNLFTNQDPTNRYIVIYNGRGADSFATVVDREALPSLMVDGATIQFSDFVVDSTNYAFETNDEEEAHYLCSVLNSHEIHEAVKPFQPEGAYGYRDIGRRPFKLPIPEFDRDDAGHIRMVESSKRAHSLVNAIEFTEDDGFRTRRRLATERLEEANIIEDINDIVLSLGMTGIQSVEEE